MRRGVRRAGDGGVFSSALEPCPVLAGCEKWPSAHEEGAMNEEEHYDPRRALTLALLRW